MKLEEGETVYHKVSGQKGIVKEVHTPTQMFPGFSYDIKYGFDKKATNIPENELTKKPTD